MADDSQAISVMISPVVGDAGFELDDVTVHRSGDRSVVRVTVDSEQGGDLDLLADLSRAVSEVLDAADPPVLGALRYTLEVTTPGVDRPLTRPRHWRRAQGRKVVVDLVDGNAIAGRVGRLGDDESTVDVVVTERGRSTVRTLSVAEVAKAVVQVDFGRATRDERHLCGLPEETDSRAPVAVWEESPRDTDPHTATDPPSDSVQAPDATRGHA
ncbi:ribosome maturation factor RimP [Williamsia sp. MIQD14]|uniref:ribosome maturation factor RimP n=1 Tax=Williamsia sp. MIQD14 TaxID=3425703 RepID=UPI003D9FFB09